jgi:hypothetical protein
MLRERALHDVRYAVYVPALAATRVEPMEALRR